MNVEDALLRYAGQPLEKLPDELRVLLEGDRDALSEFQLQSQVATLMALKRYETPDPALEGRLIHRVGTRIRNAPATRPGLSRGFDNLPAWARMAAVVAVMLTLSILTHKEMLRSEAGDAADATALELAGGGRELADSGFHLDPGSLNHLDPFTTLLPGDFTLPPESLLAPRPRRPLATAQTNSFWQPPPISLPVLFPSP